MASLRRLLLQSAVLLLACFAPLLTAWSASPHLAPPLEQAIRGLFGLHRYAELTLSPDGARVAWVEILLNGDGLPSGKTAIYEQSLRTGSRPQRVTAATGVDATETEPVFSPDGRQLAFLSDAAGTGQAQLYTVSLHRLDSPVRRTHFTGELSSPTWSPGGRTIALLGIANAPRVPGPLMPMTPPEGTIRRRTFEQRLWLLDTTSNRLQPLSPAPMYVYEYGWSPHGQRFVISAAYGSGDNNWWIAHLYTLGRQGQLQQIVKPQLQVAHPRWSPDGKSIDFIGGLMSDQGSTGGDLYQYSFAGGAVRDLTPGLKASVTWFGYYGSQIWLAENAQGETVFAYMRDAQEPPKQVFAGNETITRGGWNLRCVLQSRFHRGSAPMMAMVRQSADRPPEIWAGYVGAWRQLTNENQKFHPSWGKTVNLHWTNEGYPVQGWLTYPLHYLPGKRYGLIVDVHGGPGAAFTSSWPNPFFNVSVLSTSGYFVLRPNPRGSFGEGEAFTRANVKDFGHGDLRDILAGVSLVEKTLPVDPRRVGITGWSYGGYMSMWAPTRTSRFHASVAGAGISDWRSYYGENDIDQWMIPFFGASVYDDPQVYARSAPLTYIKSTHTPTLLLVGDRDGECPAPQSFEYWHALNTFHVPVELHVYPDEGHDILNPRHERDIIRRTVLWFNNYLAPAR